MEPLKIGNITLPHRAVFGPMAGFTDAPCRRLMAQHGAGFADVAADFIPLIVIAALTLPLAAWLFRNRLA